ncbi:LytR/AlgR family response regulator transcription factor [Penaeicola halotolerans]|uniref:LytR/AlgR family response regulator transcription factor n=1 Tax=Penaeicola halotolerans TaxID=2793196 RepID=UPI001CF888E9|nr:LytTR family DNA-binding domain-containing protein [Penaeicola halotolerans]
MTCLIVDDEPIAREILMTYINDMPSLQLVGSYEHAIAALDHLEKESVDLLFLDINMPKLSGLSLLKSLQHPPMVIFTTAYDQYAIEGYELDVVDFLLKPFSFERFVKAVSKAQKLQAQHSPSSTILVKADKKLYQVNHADILYIQAWGDYVKLFTKDKSLVLSESLKSIEERIPSGLFMRVHKSYIVAKSAIAYLEGNQLSVAGVMIPIGASYKESVVQKL